MGGIHLPGLLSGPADDYVTTKWPPALPSLPAKTHTNRARLLCRRAWLGLAQVTRMSELPQPSAAQPFHIRSLYKHAGVSEVQCEDALQVLMQLQKTNEVQAVPVGEQWFLFLPAAYAADAAMYIDEHGTAEALVVGESVRDWCVSVATMTFLKQVRRVVRDGLWFPFRMANDGHVYEHVGPRPVDTVRSQEERWYDEIGPIIDVSVVYCKRKRNILWNVRVFRGIIEALKQQPRPI